MIAVQNPECIFMKDINNDELDETELILMFSILFIFYKQELSALDQCNRNDIHSYLWDSEWNTSGR